MATSLGNLSLGLELPGLAMLDAMENRLAALDRASHVVTVNVSANGVAAAESEVNHLGAAMSALDGNVKGVTTSLMGMSAATVGILAVGAALTVAVKEAANFQQQMQNLQAVLHAPQNDLGNLGQNIQDSSKATIFTMSGIAEADRQLAKAGQDANAIMREQMDVLNLSSATQVSAAQGATAFVTAMKDFNLTAADSAKIADNLSQAVDSSIGTLSDMQQALQQVGPVAVNAGLDLKTTTAAIADLENAGLQGDAGSALKIFLQRLESPTKQAQTAMKDLGLQVYDTNGQLLSLSAIFDELQQKTRGLSDEQKNLDLTQIFGARGIRVADIASAQGSSGLTDVLKHENEIGNAAEIAATKLDTLQGQVKILTSSLSVLATNIGTGLLPLMTQLAEGATNVANAMAKVTGNISGGAAHQKEAYASAYSAVGLDDPNALEAQQAKIKDLQEKRIDAQKRYDDFWHQRVGLLGNSQLFPSMDDPGAEIKGLDAAITAEQALVDKAKKLQTDSPTLALGNLNKNIATIFNDMQSRDARSSGAPDETTQIEQHAIDAKRYIDAQAMAFINAGHTVQEWWQIETQAFADIDKRTAQMKDALEQAAVDLTQKNRDLEEQRAKLLAEGAPERTVNRALFGEDFGLTKQQIADANTALKNWQKDYAAAQAERTAGDQALTAAYTEQKRQVQELGTANEQAATKSAEAWKAANAAVGVIDKARTPDAIAGSSEGLNTAVANLAALGQGNVHLDALAGIAQKFADITKATDQAKAAFTGYMLTLSETDKNTQALDAIKTRYTQALDAAEKRQLQGTATGDDLALIASRGTALASFAEQQQGLSKNASADMLNIIQHLPDFVAIDNLQRQTVASLGGGAAVIGTIQTEAAKAESELTALEKKDRQSVITIRMETTKALQDIDTLIKAIPGDRTIRVNMQYGDAAGNPAGPPLPPGGGSTMTPRGDASALIPYAAEIQKAAAANGVPAWMLGAIIMHESGGVPGAIEQGGGLGRGLTQVDLGQHPDQYAHQAELTGTDAQSIAYQINEGAKILAQALAASGGSPQGYAGSAYRSQAGGGVPAGLDFGTELATYYQQQVQAAFATADPTRGYGAPITARTNYGPGDVALGSGQIPTGGFAPDAVVGSVRDQIVKKALQSVGVDKLVDYCEQFVEETVQAITGKRGATGINEASATAAYQHAAAMGLERPANQAPQEGDLVYYPDANGGPGHVAVYKGQGQQISTWDKGDPTGVNRQIHVESISPGAHFIMVPGTASDTSRANGAAGSGIPGQANVPGVSGASGASTPPSAATLQELANGLAHVDVAAKGVRDTFAQMNPKDIAEAEAHFNAMAPVLDKMAGVKLFGPDGPQNDAEKAKAMAEAMRQNLDLTAAWGTALTDIRTNNGHLAADEEKISQIIGGPLAANLNHQLEIMNDQARIADRITQLTERKTQMEAAHNQVLQDRQDAATADSRAQTRQGWADQAQDRALAARTAAENAAWTVESRHFEDRQRALDFYGTTRQRQLQDELTALDKAHQAALNATTAENQILSAHAFAGDTSASMRLAIGNQAAKSADTAYTQQQRAINDAIVAEQKLASQQRFDLETERLAAQRKHEDIIAGLTAEGTRNAELRAARAVAHQLDLWRIEDAHLAEDRRYTAAIKSIDDEITAQQKLATQAGDALKSAQDALAIWQQTGIEVANVGQSLGAAVSNALPGWSPAPVRSLGGTGTNAAANARSLAVAPATANGNGGTTVNLSLGDVSLMLTDADKEEINQFIAAKLNRARAGANGRPMGVIR